MLHLELKWLGGIVAPRRFDFAAIIADEDLAISLRPRLLRAALLPQRTITTLQTQESKSASVAAAGPIRQGGGLFVGTPQRGAIFRQLELVWGKLARGCMCGWQARHELRLTVGGLGDQGAGLAIAGGRVVDEFLWEEVVMFRLGLEHLWNCDGIRLGARSGLDFADKVLSRRDLDVVAEIGFVTGVAMDAIRGVGIGSAPEAICAFVLGGTFGDLWLRGICRGDLHHFVGDNLIEVAEPGEDRRALLGCQGRGDVELGAHETRTGEGGADSRLQACRAFGGGQVEFAPLLLSAEEGRVI